MSRAGYLLAHVARQLVRFDILQSRGAELLDIAERESSILPYLRSAERRSYATERGEDFEAVLDAAEPAWSRYLERTTNAV